MKVIKIKDSSYIPQVQNVIECTPEFTKRDKKILKEEVDALIDYPEESTIYACIDNNLIVGFITLEKDLPDMVLDINILCVLPEYRKQGVASNLMKKVLSRKYRKILIETESSEEYKPAVSLYLKFGFKEEARIKDFWRKGSDKIILVR